MRRSLFWRLLAINLLVVGIAVAVVALAIGQLADTIFTSLMKQFHIQTDVLHELFVRSLTLALLLASLLAGGVGIVLSIIMFRRVTSPLRGMIAMTERIGGGDYTARAPVTGTGELAALAEALNRMAGSLATLDRLRQDLVANVAHELRTPLTNLRGYLEAIHDALHQLSQFDARLPHLQPVPIDLDAIIDRLLDLRRADFDARAIAVRRGPAADGTAIRGDADSIAQAVSNLLDNALKYTPRGGTVAVEVRRDGGRVRVTVTNSGDGIAPHDLPFVFERFYRSEKSRSRESGGAGIGLSIVKEVATAHDGEVGATSGGGETVIWFSLPLGHRSGHPERA